MYNSRDISLKIFKEGMFMPLVEMKEITTPLKLLGIKFYRSSEGNVYVKFWNQPRKKIFN